MGLGSVLGRITRAIGRGAGDIGRVAQEYRQQRHFGDDYEQGVAEEARLLAQLASERAADRAGKEEDRRLRLLAFERENEARRQAEETARDQRLGRRRSAFEDTVRHLATTAKFNGQDFEVGEPPSIFGLDPQDAIAAQEAALGMLRAKRAADLAEERTRTDRERKEQSAAEARAQRMVDYGIKAHGGTPGVAPDRPDREDPEFVTARQLVLSDPYASFRYLTKTGELDEERLLDAIDRMMAARRRRQSRPGTGPSPTGFTPTFDMQGGAPGAPAPGASRFVIEEVR